MGAIAESPRSSSPARYYFVAAVIIVVDQLVKYLTHTQMLMGPAGEIPVFGEWFKLHYTLNPGMAFGVELGSIYGKQILTIFLLFAMAGISYYLWVLWKRRAPAGLQWCGGLILGGAIGNLIDSLFYGFIYQNAPFGSPMRAFYGQVIDMFYLDLWHGTLPHAWPLVGGTTLALWPIFNVADAAIFCGVAFILLNQNRFFPHGHVAVEEEVGGEKQPETFSV